MGDFTGGYYKCTDCGYIYDYDDLCPDCGGNEIEDLNANEVNEYTNDCLKKAERLKDMLQLHGDYVSNEKIKLPISDVGGWVSMDDEINPIPNDKTIQIKFEDGSIIDYDKEDWPWDIVTHWRPKP